MERQYQNTITKASSEHLLDIYALLKSVGLPTQGIEKNLHNFFVIPMKDTGKLLGCIGIELYGNQALVRSLAIQPTYHKKGLGTQLISHIHMYAKAKDVTKIYLLTTTAERFFEKFGYTKIPRKEVTKEITQSIEFKFLCPETATVMKKKI